jgi:hypothetical protein
MSDIVEAFEVEAKPNKGPENSSGNIAIQESVTKMAAGHIQGGGSSHGGHLGTERMLCCQFRQREPGRQDTRFAKEGSGNSMAGTTTRADGAGWQAPKGDPTAPFKELITAAGSTAPGLQKKVHPPLRWSPRTCAQCRR